MRNRIFSFFLTIFLSLYSGISAAPSWMHDQIAEDLKPFDISGVKSSDIDRLMQEPSSRNYLLVKFSIRNNTLSISPSSFNNDTRVIQIAKSIREILQRVSIRDLDFVATMHDALDGIEFPVPVFAFAKNPEISPTIVLIPDFEALGGNQGMLQDVEKGKSKYPWHKKVNRAFWRGATTGGIFTKENFLSFPRSSAVTLSLRYPHLVDARFTSLVQCENCDQIRRSYGSYFGDAVSVKDHLHYKYQLLIDGNTCAYSRAYWELFADCTIFKQSSPSIQWFYRCLQPYVHYVPLKSDLSDLPEAVTWAMHHDHECREISKQANAFAHGNLTREHVIEYLMTLLVEYSKLQR